MSNSELLPCPFCGGNPILDQALRDGYQNCPDDADAWAYFLRCQACAAQGGWAKSHSGAMQPWNTRVMPGDASHD